MNITLEQWDQTLADLYEVALQPDLLSTRLAQANDLLGSDFCHLLGVSPQGEVKINIVTDHSYNHAVGDYSRYFVGIDPRRKFADEKPAGITYRCSSLFSKRFVDKNEFYQEFLRPNKLRYIIGSCLLRNESMSVYASFNHNLGKAEFSDEEHKFFSSINQHLSRVLSIIEKTRPISAALNIGEHALNELHVGILGLSSDGLITYVNSQAKVELQTIPLSKSGKSRLLEGSTCYLLVKEVLNDHLPHGARLADGRIVTAFKAPKESDSSIKLDSDKTEVVLVFSQINRKGPRSSHLMEWFGLSPAEARLANALASGLSVENFSTTYSISVATARTQLRAVLKKTGTDRQQDLVRLLSALPNL